MGDAGKTGMSLAEKIGRRVTLAVALLAKSGRGDDVLTAVPKVAHKMANELELLARETHEGGHA